MFCYFSEDDLQNNTPSRRSGISYEDEQTNRKNSVELINQIAKRLKLSETCVMTAVVYMHRFYMEHSMTTYPNGLISVTTLWTATKTEKEPRKLVDIIIHGYWVSFKVNLNPKSPMLVNILNDIQNYEKVLGKTIGSNLRIEHPQVYIDKFCKLIGGEEAVARFAKKLAKSSMNSTTMCLKYRPSVLACLFVYVVAKGRGYWHIIFNRLPDGTCWYQFFEGVNEDMLDAMTEELENSIYSSCEVVEIVDEDGIEVSGCEKRVDQVSPEFVNEVKSPEDEEIRTEFDEPSSSVICNRSQLPVLV